MQLNAVRYDVFDDARHLRKLKWNRDGVPVITLKDGTKYEVTVPGKDKAKNQETMTLGDWKKVVEEIDRILIDKGILDGNEDAPVAARRLDQIMINKTGVTFEGRMITHEQGTNTKNRFENLKQAAKGHMIEMNAAAPDAVANQPAGAPAAPVAGQNRAAEPALGAMAPIDGVDMNAVLRDIDIKCEAERVSVDGNNPKYLQGGRLVNWAEFANALTQQDQKANSTVEDLNIQQDKRRAVFKAVKTRYADEAVRACKAGIANTVDAAIRGAPNWNKSDRNQVQQQARAAVLQSADVHVNGQNPTITNQAVLQRVQAEVLSDAHLNPLIASRLDALLEEEARNGIWNRAAGYLPAMPNLGLGGVVNVGGQAINGAAALAGKAWNKVWGMI